MKLSKGHDTEQADLQEELTRLQKNIQQEENQTVLFLCLKFVLYSEKYIKF